uniref:Uncharacterized protein n=1 Tax=Moniliophthora roreri TaxID=221103 RepID=A0A0W0F416_MONRR
MVDPELTIDVQLSCASHFNAGTILAYVARNIYHNITLEKLAFVRLVHEQEKEKGRYVEAWMNGLTELINITTYMRDVSQQIEDRSLAARNRLEGQSSSMIERISTAISDLLKQFEHDGSLSIKYTADTLGVLANDYAISMQNVLSHQEESLKLRLGTLFTDAHNQYQVVFEALIAAEKRWKYLQNDFWSMQESFTQLSHLATQTTLELHNMKNYTIDLYDAHLQLSQSAHSLDNQIYRISSQAQHHFDTLNNSVVLLKQTLTDTSGLYSPPHWWKEALLTMSSLVLRVDTATILEYSRSPVYRIFDVAWTVVFWLLRHSVSMATSLLLFFLSARRYVTMKPVHNTLDRPRDTNIEREITLGIVPESLGFLTDSVALPSLSWLLYPFSTCRITRVYT